MKLVIIAADPEGRSELIVRPSQDRSADFALVKLLLEFDTLGRVFLAGRKELPSRYRDEQALATHEQTIRGL